MERAFSQLEKSHMTLTANFAQLQKDKEVIQKSRDQKDKHLAVIYRGIGLQGLYGLENEKLAKRLEKYEGEVKDKENCEKVSKGLKLVLERDLRCFEHFL